jgi:hypothetical protein
MVRRAARARGEPYDPRTDVDVIKDERIAGRKASPAVSPGYYFADSGSKVVSNGTPVLPLGVNETGQRMSEATRLMYVSYPPEVRRWIDAHGGYEKFPLHGCWTLYDRELWAMGYPKCK